MAKYTKEQLEEAVKESVSFAQVCRKLGVCENGGSATHLTKTIKSLNINTSHFTGQAWSRGKKFGSKKPIERFLTYNNKNRRETAKNLRKALLHIGREYKCEKCGNDGNWDGEKLILEVDHIDCDYRNNSSDNLRFLCPNCHQQITSRHINNRKNNILKENKRKDYCDCGKIKWCSSRQCVECSNTHKHNIKQRPPKDILLNLVWEKPSYIIAHEFGVSDTLICKWCKSYNIKKPPRGYWSKQ